MITIENILEISRHVVSKIAPLEGVVFNHFAEYYQKDPKRLDFSKIENQNADLGFGSGDEATFLTPWIIFAVNEGMQLIRDVFAGIIVDRITEKKNLIPKDAITFTLLQQMKKRVYEKLHSKGFKGRESRVIADTVIDTLLLDAKASKALFAIFLTDVMDKK